MLKIDSKFVDVEMVGSFLHKLNILWGESGSGKTFLFTKLKAFLQDTGIPYIEIPHGALVETVLSILSTVQKGTVILYDSGDLSFDTEICKTIDTLDTVCIISLKTLRHAKYADYGLYTVTYTPGKLLVEELQ